MDELQQKKGWFHRLKEGLKKSSHNLTGGIQAILTKKKLDEQTLLDLEDLLISTDLGVKTAQNIVLALKKKRFNEDITQEEICQFLSQEIATILQPCEQPLSINRQHQPHVILVVGVNGSGKTTTIGKLGYHFKTQGYKVRLAAGDTFRAAAKEQLIQWGQKNNIPVECGKDGADPSGLAYDAYIKAQQEKDDVLLIDTAGRLHNKDDLMAELAKIRRVLQKLNPEVLHDCLLVLDATGGQNAHQQVTMFQTVAHVTGLIMTKLDGTAKGGILVALAEKFKLPIHAIGVGEAQEDLQEFKAQDFADALTQMKS